MGQSRRRQFLIAVGASLVTPRATWAQQKARRVAWLGVGRAGSLSPFLEAFRAGLRDRGWVEGSNLQLDVFFTDGTLEDSERVGKQAIASKPELLVVYGRDVPVASRLKPGFPVVFAFSGNPVDAGIVKSFARTETNFTGVSFMSLELAAKRIELLKEVAPNMRRLGVLARPEHAGEHRERAASEEAAAKLGLGVFYAPIQGFKDLELALRSIGDQKCDSLVTFPDAIMLANSGRIAKFAEEARIATVSGWASFADNGFLLSYGPNLRESYRGLARFADRVLRGARPSDMAVELPSVVELVLNARTARVLGLSIPPAVRARADRVIE
jgi:putative ABC transport system substrate-binding protein